MTFRHYKSGRSSAKRTGRLYPRRNAWYSLSEAESTSGHMVLSGESGDKFPVTPPGIDPGTVRLVAQCLNHYTTSVMCTENYEITKLVKCVFVTTTCGKAVVFIHSFIHSVFCLTTGPKPPPKRCLHIVRSRASSFK